MSGAGHMFQLNRMIAENRKLRKHHGKLYENLEQQLTKVATKRYHKEFRALTSEEKQLIKEMVRRRNRRTTIIVVIAFVLAIGTVTTIMINLLD